jgi:hypothetical protein
LFMVVFGTSTLFFNSQSSYCTHFFTVYCISAFRILAHTYIPQKQNLRIGT